MIFVGLKSKTDEFISSHILFLQWAKHAAANFGVSMVDDRHHDRCEAGFNYWVPNWLGLVRYGEAKSLIRKWGKW